jgi:hypothetical protein
MEYIDSMTFTNAKSLNIELTRDTSDFRWSGDTLQLLDEYKYIIHSFIDSFKYDGPIDTISPKSHHIYPLGFYKLNNQKLFLLKKDDIIDGTKNLIFEKSFKNEFVLDDIAINKYSKVICSFYSPEGIPESMFSISSFPNLKTLYSYQFDCSDKSTFEECNECICLWIQDKKWISDNDIYLQAVRFTTNKKYYFKLTLKK